MELLPNYYAWTYGLFRPWLTGEVVELGCGAGLGIATYLDRVRRVLAVDHDEALLERVRMAFPEERVRALKADLAGDWAELAGITADAVILMDVLEHFADDLGFLRKAAALVKPGGHLCVKVPAQARLYSPMDEASGHFRRYDPEDLRRLAAALGLAVVELTPINRLGGLAYRFRNRRPTNLSRSFTPLQLKAINLALPLVRRLDGVSRAPGLSLAAVFANEASG